MTLIEVGKVARPHGVRGEIRIRLHWADSEALDTARRVWLSRRGGAPEAFDVASVRHVPKAVLLRLAGIEDRDAAERLKGRTVSVPRKALPPLDEGEYYLADLVGATVVGPGGRIGTVVEIRVHPSVDALVIELPDGTQREQPLAPPWVERVDAAEGLVTLTTTDGLV